MEIVAHEQVGYYMIYPAPGCVTSSTSGYKSCAGARTWVSSSRLTLPWNMAMFKHVSTWYISCKWVIFHGYVSLPEGKSSINLGIFHCQVVIPEGLASSQGVSLQDQSTDTGFSFLTHLFAKKELLIYPLVN
jgi:hypothetical protein